MNWTDRNSRVRSNVFTGRRPSWYGIDEWYVGVRLEIKVRAKWRSKKNRENGTENETYELEVFRRKWMVN